MKTWKILKMTTAILTLSVLLAGCGLFGGEDKGLEIDPPQETTYLEEGEFTDGESVMDSEQEAGVSVDVQEDGVADTVQRELFLLDQYGMVVPQTVELPIVEGPAKQALEYLVQDGPVEEMLPNGFRAVLPAGTSVEVNIVEGGTVIADFSKEFEEYNKEDELKILQAITWTLTQFETIDKVQIRINGYDQSVMPVNGTPIGEGVSREHGINFDENEVADITNSYPVTVYFLAENADSIYYVPVTRRVANTEENSIVAVINELVEGPSYTSKLLGAINNEVELLSEPIIQDGQVILNFNEYILGSFSEEPIINTNVLDTLVLTLTEQEGIEQVAIQVNGEAELVNEQGELLAEPVSRPKNVNMDSF
ncbi:GerMN domain-containing protein [Cytobacillus sp. IB215665]|uniref:GerMN domain-containing protein n=1 Tax=Cytobacillus sp. IB215665 TaxID=3097357 RepID=UPI002A139EE3|nr:GerMN domain-containing protein [Cytobacillus sp. IB215665]MDX8364015.1 GerMN domain-containing protein [Cytobacillus sp. IB215665]